MTISSTHSFVSFVANGTDTEFEFNFVLFDAGDMYVYVSGSVVDSANYTVKIDEDNNGGSVVFDSPPGVNTVVRLSRSMTIDQQTDYPVGGPFPATSHERALDKLTMIAQDIMTLVTDQSFGVLWKGTWAASILYAARDMVVGPNGNFYLATESHISGAGFDADSDYWVIAFDFAELNQLVQSAAQSAFTASADATIATSAAMAASASETLAAASEANAAISENNAANCSFSANAAAVAAAASAAEAASLVATGVRTDAISQDYFSASAGQTVFTLTETPAADEALIVFMNSRKLRLTEDYTVSTNTIVLNDAAADGDEIDVTNFNLSILVT